MFNLRPATRHDSRAIRMLIWKVGINPIGLDWRRFLVAVDEHTQLLGCGQIKPHGDGSRELASIAVQPNARGQGIAQAIIVRLLEGQPLPIYLTCRDTLESFYRKFGFAVISPEQAPPYFQRIARLVALLRRITRSKRSLLIMRKSA